MTDKTPETENTAGLSSEKKATVLPEDRGKEGQEVGAKENKEFQYKNPGQDFAGVPPKQPGNSLVGKGLAGSAGVFLGLLFGGPFGMLIGLGVGVVAVPIVQKLTNLTEKSAKMAGKAIVKESSKRIRKRKEKRKEKKLSKDKVNKLHKDRPRKATRKTEGLATTGRSTPVEFDLKAMTKISNGLKPDKRSRNGKLRNGLSSKISTAQSAARAINNTTKIVKAARLRR
ncbi:hypothetical protein [Fulvivirga sediminis]|uniref:Uncharacterized protein n=1 Tax=Fulvivirga sediminis TaxID=2803949 RepID=A0A937F7B1_9BACT|nr:hypothetical protein [Fulvivirga sediminis]MBL3657681.1 hypothetical protein [Fulvivirga sediminis]